MTLTIAKPPPRFERLSPGIECIQQCAKLFVVRREAHRVLGYMALLTQGLCTILLDGFSKVGDNFYRVYAGKDAPSRIPIQP